MISNQTIALLESFIGGRTHLSDFKQKINDRLFELRQQSVMNEEKKLLSKIQLYFHETDEGTREISDIYTVSQAVLNLAKPSATHV